jgi:hypothetical protein
MRVIVIIKGNADSETGKMPSDELFREMGNFNEELVKAGIMLSAEGLLPSSKGKRVRFEGTKKKSVIDGPFAESKELVAGFWIWKVKSMEEAVEWVKRIPNTDAKETDVSEIEIRQIGELEDFADIPQDVKDQEARLRAATETR